MGTVLCSGAFGDNLGCMTWLVALVCALSAAAHLRFVVPHLREPATTDDEPAPHYARLAPRMHVILIALAVFALAQVLHLVPTPHLGAWFGYLGAGAALVWVDLRTTWLPRTLNTICLAQVAAGLTWVAIHDWQTALAALTGGVMSFILFHLVWRYSTTFGYGDVRLAATVGTMGALRGVDGWLMALFFATLTGAVWAIVHALLQRRREGPDYFAYGPALWLGPILAVVISGW